MGLHHKLPVYKESYDLLLEICKYTEQMNKSYKYSIGQRLQENSLDLLQYIYKANKKRVKKEMLEEALEKAALLQLELRVLKDLRQLSMKRYVHFSFRIDNITRQLGGWLRSVRNHES